MKTKLFTLLTLLVAVCSGAWAEDVCSANLGLITPDATSNQTETVAGTLCNITWKRTVSNSTSNYVTSGGDNYWKFNTSDYVTLTLTGTDAEFKDGDVLTATLCGSGKNKTVGFKLKTTSGNGSTGTSDATNGKTTPVEVSYTITAADINDGNKSITIYRNGADDRFFDFAITRTSAGPDETAPTLSSTTPASDATDVALSGNIVLTFDENVACTTNATLTPAEGEAINLTPVVSGATVSYVYSNLTKNTKYTFNLAANSVADLAGNKYASAVNFSFTTANANAVTATWAFNTADPSTTPTYSPAAASGFFKNETVTLGSNLTYTKATQELKVSNASLSPREYSTKITISASGSATSEENAIVFKATPKTGITFTPTRVSFRATRCGTDGGAMVMSWIDANASAVALGTAAAAKTGDGATDPARDNNATQNWTDYVYDLTAKGAVATTGEFGLKIIVHGVSSKQYAFSNIVIEGTYAGEVADVTTHDVTVSVAEGQTDYGTVTPVGTSSVDDGDDLEITATAKEGYVFTNWTIDGVASATTDNPYTFENVTTTHTAVANFKKLYNVTYSLSTYTGDLTGKQLNNYSAVNNLNEKYADANDEYTIPAYAHKYLYNEGYVFNKWSDGNGNTYDSGETITLTGDITLTPTWTATTKTLANDATAATEVTWQLGKSSIVFVDWQSNNYGYYTQEATVGGEKISVPMKIVNGKIANYTRGDALAQTNVNTKFTIPAVKGMVVALADASKEFSTTTIAGSTDYEGTGTKSISYTYTGEDATIDIVINESNQYLTTIAVTYPQTATAPATEQGGDVVFDLKNNRSTTVSGDGTTTDGITLKSSGSMSGSDGSAYLNISGSGTFTLSAADGKVITKIVVTYTESGANRTGGGESLTTDPTGYTVDGTTGTWETADYAGAASVVFTVANTARISSIAVNYATKFTTLNASGYGTFSYGGDVEVFGVKAYKAALDTENNKITCSAVADNQVPVGNGVLLYSETASAPVYLRSLASAPAALSGNDLKGTTNASNETVSKDDTKYQYVLNGNTFKHFTGTAFSANKAYFESATDLASGGARAFTIVFDDGETTGISDATRLMDNGEMTKDKAFFNLNGQRVSLPSRGLYIVNGKKVVIK